MIGQNELLPVTGSYLVAQSLGVQLPLTNLFYI